MKYTMKQKILRMFSQLRRWFSCNAGFIFLFFIINYFTMAWSLFEDEKHDVMIGYGFTLLFITIVITACLEILRNKLLIKLLKIGVIFLCLIPFIVELFVMYNYRALIGIGIINSILGTNLNEVIEFIEMYFGVKEYTMIGVFIVVCFFTYKCDWKSKIKVSYHLQSRLLAGVLILCVGYAMRMLVVYTDFFYKELLPIQRTFIATGVAVDNVQAYKKLKEQVTCDVTITENKSEIKNIVFILGESANRNHMQLYGYYLPNTPHLQEMADKNEIAVFRDVISPHSTTIAVLCKLFTFCNFEAEKPWYEYSHLINIMNSAGYKTHWLSNQESSGMWGNVAQIFANHSTMHRFTRIRDSLEDTGIEDAELLPLLDAAKQESKNSSKNFYVLHLMGGHGLYYNRYPYSFHKFWAKDIQLDVKESEKEIVAQYDNALYYNDYIVKEIINRFRDEEAIVIYVPDHGEAVYDEGGMVAGHIEENPNRHMIEIPFIIWASTEFKEKYPRKWKRINNAVNRPYMTDDMIHTILDISDIKTSDYESERSIISDDFDATRKRIFNELDYDLQIKTGNIPKGKK